MNRRQLLIAAGAIAVSPPASADPSMPFVGDVTYRADLSDGRRVTCYEGIDVLMHRVGQLCPFDGTRCTPHVRQIERYNRETMRWEFYAGQRVSRRKQATGEE